MMKENLIKFFNLIKNNKQAKGLLIVGTLVIFIFTLGFSLSMFTSNNSSKTANIKVNDLSFNITTNNATSNDRILHLKAGKTELFNVIITNLNNINTTYELIYDICTNSECTNTLNSLPNGVKVEYLTENSDTLNGKINNNNGTKTINIITTNTTSSDVYIRLNLNAGYDWNNLVLANQIKEYKNETNIIAYVDGVEQKNYPDNCNYTAEAKAYIGSQQVTLENLTVTCNKSTKKWTTNFTGHADRIEVKFTYSPSPSLVNYLLNLDKTKNGLEVDETTDKNLRYVGASPKNYLKFNDEIWRIIGVFNNITTIDEQENEKTESLVKIVRNDSLGDYSWDSSRSTTNSGYGVNEWSQADLMTELNCDGSGSKAYCRDDITEGYLSNLTTGSTTWYNGSNNSKNGTYDYDKNIRSLSIDKVAKVRWNLGGYNTVASALNMYNAERGTAHISNPSDGITRTNTWDGKIALIYPSDYGYASTDTTCRSGLGSTNCKNENWLFNSTYQRTLSPNSGNAHNVFLVRSGGNVVSSGSARGAYGVRPVLFLKSDVVKAGGTGESIENAYTLE